MAVINHPSFGKLAEDRIIIFDTTLRDGEQSPGFSMNLDEKLRMAEALADLGVDVMEAGFPIASVGDFQSVESIAKRFSKDGPVICGLARTSPADILRAAEAVKPAARPRIHTFVSTSPLHMRVKLRMEPEAVLELVTASVSLARQHTDDVEWSAEDGTRTEHDFLCRCVEAAIKAGATTINIPDTVGYAVPEDMFAIFTMLRERVPGADGVIFSTHNHNDLGLAVANTLAAIRAGVRQVECTINGIGERAGNASLEEAVMALRTRHDAIPTANGIVTTKLLKVSKLLAATTGFDVQPNKAIVGRNAFAHESGIHQDGVLKDASTYEIMTPESVGWKGEGLVMGKHSGRHAFTQRLTQLGFDLQGDALEKAFTRFKEVADKKKDIFDDDLIALAEEALFVDASDTWELVYMSANSGTSAIPTATVKMKYKDQEFVDAAMGDGPVDAVFHAIDRITGNPLRVSEYQLEAVTGGQDALGRVTLSVRRQEGNSKLKAKGRAVATDVVLASAKAYVHALNSLDRLEKIQSTEPRDETITSTP